MNLTDHVNLEHLEDLFLFPSERDYRIDSRRPPSRKVAREERDDEEEDRDGAEADRVEWADVEEERSGEVGEHRREDQTHADANPCEHEAVADDQPEDV